jgi:hypothetical protein
MTEALYAHMNNKTINILKKSVPFFAQTAKISNPSACF